MGTVVFIGFNSDTKTDVALRKLAAERRVDKTVILREAVKAYLAANAHKPGLERAISDTIDWLLDDDFSPEEAKASIVAYVRLDVQDGGEQ